MVAPAPSAASIVLLRKGVDGMSAALMFATLVTILVDRPWRALVFPKKTPATGRPA